MYKTGTVVSFESVEQFNDLLFSIKEDSYSEFVKISKFFSDSVEANGSDSFNSLLVFFNSSKEMVGLASCRPVDGKQDLYKALAQMLFLPASIDSGLFILAQDANITVMDKNNFSAEPKKTDALIVTYVTKQKCVVFTVPYSLNQEKKVVYDFDQAYLNSVATSDGTTKEVPRGDMIELFFIFSHMDTSGPFAFHEVLNFMKKNGFNYQIINPSALDQKRIGIPVIMQG